MLLVAFSRRICCSRVCSARRKAGRPAVSVLTPTRRPGKLLAYACVVAMNAAWGPPKAIGTPNRCADPTAMSAPNSPGDVKRTQAKRSVTTTVIPPSALTALIVSDHSPTQPVDEGYENSAPKTSPGMSELSSPIIKSMPKGSARVAITAKVWGCVSRWAKNLLLATLLTRRAMVIASAAAVASSNNEAFAMGKPVRSQTIV